MNEITNAIPGLANEALQQFVWRQMVEGWICVCAALVTVGAIAFLVWRFWNNEDVDRDLALALICGFGALVLLIFVACAITAFLNCAAPLPALLRAAR